MYQENIAITTEVKYNSAHNKDVYLDINKDKVDGDSSIRPPIPTRQRRADRLVNDPGRRHKGRHMEEQRQW